MFDARHLQNVQPAIALRCFEKIYVARTKTGKTGSHLLGVRRITRSGAHGVMRPTWQTVLAVATEDVRLYTQFLLLEP